MLVLAAFVRRTLAEIAQVPGVVSPTFASRAVGADYSYDRAPAHLVLYVNGGIGNPSRAFATALSVVGVLAGDAPAGLDRRVQGRGGGRFRNGCDDARNARLAGGRVRARDASPDFIDRALRAISATTAEDVQRVARTYLGNPTIALVLPRDEAPRTRQRIEPP